MALLILGTRHAFSGLVSFAIPTVHRPLPEGYHYTSSLMRIVRVVALLVALIVAMAFIIDTSQLESWTGMVMDVERKTSPRVILATFFGGQQEELRSVCATLLSARAVGFTEFVLIGQGTSRRAKMSPGGFLSAVSPLRSFVESELDPKKDYMLFVDAFDVRFLKGPAEHVRRYEKHFHVDDSRIPPVVVQGDPTCFCDDFCAVYKERSNSSSGIHNQIYPNTGWYFSRANELLRFWKQTFRGASDRGIDQGWVCAYGVKLFSAEHFHVDSRSTLSKNMNFGDGKVEEGSSVSFTAYFRDGAVESCVDNLSESVPSRKLKCLPKAPSGSHNAHLAWLSVHFSGPAKLYMSTTTDYFKENFAQFDFRERKGALAELLKTQLLVRQEDYWVRRPLGDMCRPHIDSMFLV